MPPFRRCTVITRSDHPVEPALAWARALGAEPVYLVGAVRRLVSAVPFQLFGPSAHFAGGGPGRRWPPSPPT